MTTTKKKIYFKEVSKKTRAAGGQNVTACIYVVKRGEVVELGRVTWNTASYKGEKSEIYTFLKKNKVVSAKEFADNKGYYVQSNSKVIIKEL